MLEERLSQLEKKESAPADLKKVPSQGQAYFYRSKIAYSGQPESSPVSSIVRVEQDAAFVATDLYITAVRSMSDTEPTEGIVLPSSSLVKFITTSSGRDLTIATRKNIAANNFFDFGVPLAALNPLYGVESAQVRWGLDYHYRLPCEYLLPRGATVEALLIGVPLAVPPPTIFNIGIDYVLGGYKVFGA
jgi:hypothetical protein